LLLASVGVSSALHLFVFSALVIDAVWPYLHLSSPLQRSPIFAIALDARAASSSATIESMPEAKPIELWQDHSIVPTSEVVSIGVPSSSVDNPDANQAPPIIAAETTADALRHVAQQIQVAAERAGERSQDENLKQLQSLSTRLDRLSSQQAVGDIARSLGQWLQTAPRATEPVAAQVAGEFDYATAQLHEVRRRRNEQGQWQYWAVLVDEAGRLRESAMEPDEGASAYQTMQVVKSSPLAEMVYRRIAMSLLDQVIKAAQEAQRAADEAAEQMKEKSGSPRP
jgi:hypothetical protein